LVQIAATILSGNSLRQTVHTHRSSVHRAVKLVAALLWVARVTAGLPRTGISYGTLRSVVECELPFLVGLLCLQHFDTVSWASGRASGVYDGCWCGHLSGERCRLFAYGSADASAIPKPQHLMPHLNPHWFYLSGTGLPRLQVVLEKSPLKGCRRSGSTSSRPTDDISTRKWRLLFTFSERYLPSWMFKNSACLLVTRVERVSQYDAVLMVYCIVFGMQ